MATELKKEVGLLGLTASGVGLILGAGIYAIIGKAAGLAGSQLWLSFVLGAVISSFTGLSYAELSTAIPKAAAEYSYIQEAFHVSLASFLVGWIIIVTESVAAAAVSLSFGGYLKGFLGTPVTPVAVLLIIMLSLLNYVGLEFSTRINLVFSVIEVVGLVLVIVLGIPFLGSVDYNFSPNGFKGVFQGAALIFFAYIGFESIVNLVEETPNPGRDMPRALILSIAITALLYILVAVSSVSLVSWNELSTSPNPLATAAAQAIGARSFLIISVIALFATSNTVLILLIVCSRNIYGMSREGRLPRFFSRISVRGTPAMAVALTLVLSAGFSLLEDLSLVAEITNLGTFITFCSVNLAAIWLRLKKPELERPFRTPFEVKGIPIISLIGLVTSGLLITQLSVEAVLMGSVFIPIGILFYWFCKTPLAKRLQCDINQ
jgi:APA family basic amino acid/polyamine antiporter